MVRFHLLNATVRNNSVQKTNTMKKTFIIIVGILAPIALQAQSGEGRGPKGEGRRPQGPPPAVLEKFDANKDGKLDESERKAAGEAMKAKREEMIAKFDKDGDGELNAEERKAAGEARKAMMLEKFDADQDGELSKEERAAAMKEMGGRRGGPRGERGPKGKGAPRGEGRPEGRGPRGSKGPKGAEEAGE